MFLQRARYLFQRAKHFFFKYLFDIQCRKIRDTPASEYRYRNDLKIVTQLQHDAVNMYLLAIKSFLYHLGSGSVHVLDDGSLTADDRALLSKHIPYIHIEHINTIDTGKCPRGGTWERLVYILGLSNDAYVIQLDSDVLVMNPLVEVSNAIENNRGFIIGGPQWPEPVTVSLLNDIVTRWGSNQEHVQVKAEKNFHSLKFFSENHHYIRGCSAFTGFPKKQITKDMLERFSIEISHIIGDEKWNEWGSEQVASNVMVSQMQGPLILPWPRYQNYKFPKAYGDSIHNTALIHFIGVHRFSDRVYEQQARHLINRLNYGGQ